MRNVAFLLFFLILAPIANAAESYAVEKPDGSVAIVNYFGGADSLSDVIEELGFSGYPIIRISASDLPDRSDREFWSFNDVPLGKKIKVDTDKKAAKEADKAQKRAEIDAVLLKLKVTEDEVKKLKDVLK